jgi:SAM-dependent methyltransferase
MATGALGRTRSTLGGDFGKAGPNRRIWLPRGLQQTANRVADRLMGIESADEVRLSSIGVEAKFGIDYRVTSWFQLLKVRRILDELDITPRDAFLDLGAGKGRVLWLAARYPFGRVIGVELSAALAETARRNLAKNPVRLACRDIQVEAVDATEYDVPDDVSVVFMNHPFTGPVFERVTDKLCASVGRSPRVMTLIYNHPVMGEYLAGRGFRVLRKDGNLVTYVVPPVPASAP